MIRLKIAFQLELKSSFVRYMMINSLGKQLFSHLSFSYFLGKDMIGIVGVFG